MIKPTFRSLESPTFTGRFTLGFAVENAGGQMFVYTGGLSKLIEVADEIGYSDPWLEERRHEKSQDSLVTIS